MTAPDFEKHRQESIDFEIDFTPALDKGDNLSTADELDVTARSTSSPTFISKSTEFGNPTAVASSDAVQFTIAAATDSTFQRAGSYFIRAEITTANGETLNTVKKLKVEELGDPSFTT